MAQFGGKNPPWAREVAGQAAGVTMVGNLTGQQMLSQQGIATAQGTVYSLGGAAQPQHQFSVQQPGGVAGLQGPLMHHQAAAALQQSVQLPQPGIAIPTTLATTQVATVSYPTPRAAAQGPQPKQRVFTGSVTKLHDNFGFVDEDVFFQTSCVKGNLPKVGDRVLVEAAYNANMPFKWNATRIQVLPTQPQPGSNTSSANTNYNTQGRNIAPNMSQSHPAPLMGQMNNQGRGSRDSGMNNSSSNSYRDRDRGSSHTESNSSSSRHMTNSSSGTERSRSHRDRDRRSSPARRRSRSPRRRSRSPSRTTRSPPRRRAPRVVPRYTVQVPKLSLDTKEANVMTLKSRYSNMYIPSDFFHAAFTWVEAFPTHRPLQLGQPCTFHVMHKEVDALVKHDAILEPPDADHLYSAKVMLMACPTMEELYKRSCALAEDSSEVRESFQHPTRLINFLVGLKGKSEPMAIGGPWSPSLDGANPATDPRTLINTAIRTTRALTGIDLAVCTQWYRFAEIRYHRPEEVHKGRTLPARVETVVLFLPDVWSCNPSRLEWEQMGIKFKQQLADKLVEENKEDSAQDEDEEGGDEEGNEKKDPSHYSELDPKTMKVNDLRRELEARSLSSKGLKSQLIARLTKAIKTEQEKEEQEAEDQKEEEEEKEPEPEKEPEVDDKDEERKRREEEERKRREERDRAARERRYNLPENPSILVHPSTIAKGGKFDCTVMSLSVLLDYRPDDNKEHTFEVSLFAELFNEMLMRDCGFTIYKSLVAAPDKPKEEKKDKKDKDKDDKKDDKEKKDKDDKKDKDEKADKEKDKDEEEPPSKRRKSSVEDKDKKEEKDKEKEEEKKEKEDRRKEEKEKDKKEEEDEDDDDDDDKSTTASDGKKKRSKDSDKKREKLKYFTAEPHLLLSFVYFDQSHTGYLLDKDMEEIIHTLGFSLSRAQIKKAVGKLVSRDTLNYRKLTDKAKPKEEKKEEGEEKVEEEQKMEVEETPAASILAMPDDETLAQGNKPLLSSKKEASSPTVSTPSRSSKRNSGNKKEDGGSGEGITGLVNYKGALLDINSVMARLEKSEKTKRDTEAKLKDTQEDMDMLKSSFNSSEQNSQKVALELQELKKKLRDQRKATERAEHDAKKYYETLNKSRAPLSSLLQDIKDTLGTGFKSPSSSSSSSDVKTEPKEEVNGD